MIGRRKSPASYKISVTQACLLGFAAGIESPCSMHALKQMATTDHRLSSAIGMTHRYPWPEIMIARKMPTTDQVVSSVYYVCGIHIDVSNSKAYYLPLTLKYHSTNGLFLILWAVGTVLSRDEIEVAGCRPPRRCCQLIAMTAYGRHVCRCLRSLDMLCVRGILV